MLYTTLHTPFIRLLWFLSLPGSTVLQTMPTVTEYPFYRRNYSSHGGRETPVPVVAIFNKNVCGELSWKGLVCSLPQVKCPAIQKLDRFKPRNCLAKTYRFGSCKYCLVRFIHTINQSIIDNNFNTLWFVLLILWHNSHSNTIEQLLEPKKGWKRTVLNQ